MLQSCIHQILFKLFLLLCRTLSIMNDSINILLDKNDTLKWVVMEIIYRIKCARYIIIGQRFESRDTPYINTYSINDKYNLVETSSSIQDEYIFQDFDEVSGYDLIQSIPTFVSRIYTENISPLIVIKCWNDELDEDMYLVRSGPFSTNNPFSNKKGPVKFLSIEYSHSEMIEPIELVFNTNWIIVGNELFTPSFVLRALEYQSKSYYFDKDYKIQIMDTNFDILNLTYYTYIEITNEGYECYYHNSSVKIDGQQEEGQEEEGQEEEGQEEEGQEDKKFV